MPNKIRVFKNISFRDYRDFYSSVKRQFSLKSNDPRLKIKWRIKKPILSSRDRKAQLL